MSASIPTATPTRVSRLRDLAGREWMLYLITLIGSTLTTVTSLKLWKADWSIPFTYGNDSILNVAGFKTIIETGWYESQPLLSAPAGQAFNDWKISDSLGYAFAKLGSLFSHDAAFLVNFYYVIGFVLAALTGLWFLRFVGVGRVLSVVLAILFAIAPFHFARGEAHLFFSAYFPLSFALGIVYLAMRGRPLWGLRKGATGWRAWLLSPGAFTIFAMALIACANSYYSVFTVLLIAFAGLVSLVRDRNWKRFLGAAVAGLVTVLVVVLNMLPDTIYALQHGNNSAAVSRTPTGVEVYQLKFMQLILPAPGHRVPILASLRQFYDENFPLPSESPALGLIAALGFVALLAVALYFAVVRLRRVVDPAERARRDAIGALSGLTLFAFLLATVGGFSTIVGFLTSELRGWNRISIVIALFSLAGLGLILDAALAALGKRRFMLRTGVATAATAALAIGMLGVGYLDQVTTFAEPPYAASAAEYTNDATMVTDITSAVGADASIVQLPYREFPESASAYGVPDSDQLKPYLHSSTLSWTGGGIKGRPAAEWTRWLQDLPADQLTRSAAVAGFAGILVDLRSYGTDTGQVTDIKKQLGAPVVTSPDGRYEFFALAPALAAAHQKYSTAELKLIGDSTVNPVLARLEPDPARGFNAIDLLKSYHPRILLENPRSVSVRIEVKFTVANTLGNAVLRFTAPDGSYTDVQTGPTPHTLTIPTTAAPGRTYLDISVVSGVPFPNRTTTVLRNDRITTDDVALLTLLNRQ